MTGKHSSVQRRQTLKAYGFMTPALIIIILFTIINSPLNNFRHYVVQPRYLQNFIYRKTRSADIGLTTYFFNFFIPAEQHSYTRTVHKR